MIITALSVAAALAEAPPQEYPSRLMMDPTHEYAWVEVVEKEGARVWWDRNAKGSIFFERREYPVVLVRVHTNASGAPSFQADLGYAVDCDNNQIATIKGYFPWRKGDVEWELKFRPWPDPDSEGIHALMREVCSEGSTK